MRAMAERMNTRADLMDFPRRTGLLRAALRWCRDVAPVRRSHEPSARCSRLRPAQGAPRARFIHRGM